jgi:alpha-1,2-mannosyltransferase
MSKQSISRQPTSRIDSLAAWLSPRRIRAQAIVLALCLWSVCAIDFATPGLFDRVGNIKFQDFLPLYTSARMIAQGRDAELYNQEAVAREEHAIVTQPTRAVLPNIYGPQVTLVFVPLSRLSFATAAWTWVALSLLTYAACVILILKKCPHLSLLFAEVALVALAFPPLILFLIRGQTSALALACFTAAYLAFDGDRPWLAGIALGVLAFKPQFLVGVAPVLLFAGCWKSFAGMAASAAGQLGFAWIYFGSAVMRAYFGALWHVSRWIDNVELSLAPIQMHSLRSFWSLLIPWPAVASTLYGACAIAVVALGVRAWKSSSPLAARFSVLTLAAVLINPHLFVYDLLVLAPVFLLIANSMSKEAQRKVQQAPSPLLSLLLHLTFMLPLLGPLSRWTHLQLSVPAFAALLWVLSRHRASVAATSGHLLASPESRVV